MRQISKGGWTMHRIVAGMSRIARVAVPLAVSLVALPVFAGSATSYSSESTFTAALGGPVTRETFDEFQDGVAINDQISGLFFHSPGEGYSVTSALSTETAKSAPLVLSGGTPTDVSNSQIILVDFSEGLQGVGFWVTGIAPSASAVTVRLYFADETSEDFQVSDTDANEATPEFIGFVADASTITGLQITSGLVPPIEGPSLVYDQIGLDDLLRPGSAESDCCAPICTGSPATVEGVLGISGNGSDSGESSSGIDSIVLEEGATNVCLSVDEFASGASLVNLRAVPCDSLLDGQGTVLVTDVSGKTCELPVTFRDVNPGPVNGLLICSGSGTLLSVSNPVSGPGGPAACSVEAPGPDDPSLPPGYDASPSDDPFPCTVMTIKSPISGSTLMSYKKDGVFEPNLRLLYSHFDGTVFPPFADITSSVDQIATLTPDPTRVQGTGNWSQVKVTCATLSSCTTVGPSEDFDGDGVPRCPATTGGAFDCNDQLASIHPGATEICNGMDDNCDGQIDEGHPAGGAACSIPGLLGVCAQGQTSCAAGPMVCQQVNQPSPDVCDGKDNDCDGLVDEGDVFGGYLQPVNANGTSIFKRGRAVPLKFQLTDCSGHNVASAVATVHVFFYSNGVVGSEIEDVTSVGKANTDDLYRYDPTSQQYVYNLDTSPLRTNATYLVRTHLDDGSDHDVLISLR
jgi:hypothetical protein